MILHLYDLFDFVDIKEDGESLQLLFRLEVQRQLDEAGSLRSASRRQLVVQVDADVDKDDLIVLIQLEHVAVQLGHDLEETVRLLFVALVVLRRLHSDQTLIARVLEVRIRNKLRNERTEHRVLKADEDGPLALRLRLLKGGHVARILVAHVVRADLNDQRELQMDRELTLERGLDGRLVLSRELPLDVLLVLLVHVGVVELALEEAGHGLTAHGAVVSILEVHSHALDAKAVATRQERRLNHKVEAHAAVLFGFLELLLVELVEELRHVLLHLAAVLAGLLQIVFVFACGGCLLAFCRSIIF